MVKRLSHDLIEKYPYSFDENFQDNKDFLEEIGLDVSKKLRNKIAGYVTRVVASELAREGTEEREVMPLETSETPETSEEDTVEESENVEEVNNITEDPTIEGE